MQITIIPRYGQIKNTIFRLVPITDSLEEDEKEHVVALNFEIRDEDIGKLAELKEFVDLIVVRGITESSLDDIYHSLSSKELDINEEFVFYSPTAEKHKGKMSHSSQSDAVYEWIINRPEEPVKGEAPVALLLQNIKPNGKTSNHYHDNTREGFLSLAGQTILGGRAVRDKISSSEQILGKDSFIFVEQKTPHQLRTTNGRALNCLCLKPYDPDMKDHFYE
ncbi:MAG: hypothetical protein V3V78_03400 [Candidatus Woesearchaeota archaeon]